MNNNLASTKLKKQVLKVTGLSADRKLSGKSFEVPNHPMVCSMSISIQNLHQPPRDGHPLFEGFVKAARENQLKTEK